VLDFVQLDRREMKIWLLEAEGTRAPCPPPVAGDANENDDDEIAYFSVMR